MGGLLAILLFSPAFGVLAWIYRRIAAARGESAQTSLLWIAAAVIVASAAAVMLHQWPWANAGPIWPQVAAVLGAFFAYPMVLLLALLRLQRRR